MIDEQGRPGAGYTADRRPRLSIPFPLVQHLPQRASEVEMNTVMSGVFVTGIPLAVQASG